MSKENSPALSPEDRLERDRRARQVLLEQANSQRRVMVENAQTPQDEADAEEWFKQQKKEIEQAQINPERIYDNDL